ncbi:MAG: class flavin-dependent oxidoreductase [Microvirga sp.]|jgi:hypothetical protein|nr:class flavin-dependent oxidoreductase [Microvirga sp.]
MSHGKKMVLGGLFEANGYHSSAWLLPSAQDKAPTDVDYFRRILQIAETASWISSSSPTRRPRARRTSTPGRAGRST